MNAVTDYKRKIYATRDLPTLPVIAQKILLLADDDEAGADKLAKIISSDQALSVKVLRLANSAYYGYRAQISTVKQALVVIGIDMLKQVALSVLVVKTLNRGQKDRAGFWKHSLIAAHASSMIAKRTGGIPDVCFMAGLLHDVGKLIIVSNLPDAYAKVTALVGRTGCSLKDAELEVLDTDHAEVGAWMAERWQLPVELVDAIRLHHTESTDGPPQSRIVMCVRAADIYAHATAEEIVIPADLLASLGLSEAKLQEVARELQVRSQEIHQFVG